MTTTPVTSELTEILPTLTGLLGQVADALRRDGFADATRLARAGRYAEAEARLRARDVAGESDGSSLDLLARIRVQQGRLAEAEALWQRAAKLMGGEASVDNAAIVEALAAVRAAQRGNASALWPRLWPVMMLVAVFAAAGGVVVKQVRSNAARATMQAANDRALQSELRQMREFAARGLDGVAQAQEALSSAVGDINTRLNALAAGQNSGEEKLAHLEKTQSEAGVAQTQAVANLGKRLLERFISLERSNGESVERHAAAQDQLREQVGIVGRDVARVMTRLEPAQKRSLTSPDLGSLVGVKFARQGELVAAWFPGGLFHRGTAFVRFGSGEILRTLGQALHRSPQMPVRVEVLGCAEGALFSSREVLALKRAAIVAQKLTVASGLPADRVLARAATRAEIGQQAARATGLIEAESIVVKIVFGTEVSGEASQDHN